MNMCSLNLRGVHSLANIGRPLLALLQPIKHVEPATGPLAAAFPGQTGLHVL